MEYYVIDLKSCILHYAGKSKFDFKWTHYERVHNEVIIYVIIEGALFLKVDGEEMALEPGSALFMKPYTHHVGFDKSKVSFFWLHCIFNDMMILNEQEAYHFLKTNTDPDKLLFSSRFNLQDTGKFMILMNQLIHYALEDHNNIIIPYLFKASLIELVNSDKNLTHVIQFKNRRFQEIVAYIHANFKEDLKVRDLAARFGYNEKYLVKLFKKQFGMTTVEYISDVRLEYCALKLLETTDTITNIAHVGGFKNEFYFMRCFKKKYDVSPTHYRNTYHLQNITKYSDH